MAKKALAKKLTVKVPALGAQRYDVRIGSGLLAGAVDGLVTAGMGVLVVIDHNLSRERVESVLRSLDQAKCRWSVSVVTATEADKSLLAVERGLAEAARLRLGRDGLVVALGGGIVCDVAGFIAATFARGVRVVQCPTTLLAMVDASVGGKTGVNITIAGSDGKPRLLKNMVGAFHHPVRVVCDVQTLASLPLREMRCGLAECVKHAIIGGVAGETKLFAWTQKNLAGFFKLDPNRLCELIARNVAIKAKVVSKDPLELSSGQDGGRMMLNLGHTFAHVLETTPGLSWRQTDGSIQIGPLKHGEAVGLGLLCAARVATGLKLQKPRLADATLAMLTAIGLPTAIEGLPDGAALVERMLDDKKAKDGKVRLILPAAGGGKCKVVATTPARLVIGAFDSLRAPT